PRSVTARALAIGVPLIWLNAYWLVQMERIRYSAHPTTVSLFFNAVFILLVLTLLNPLMGRIRPRWALSRGELLVIYTLMAVSSTLPAHDMLQILVPMLTWPFKFRDQHKEWEPFIPQLPRAWMVDDPQVYNPYYEGNDTLYRWAYLRAWAG